MALKIGELYAILGLESKDFYKDLDKAEKGMTGLSATFFKAVTASGQFARSLEEPRKQAEALEKLLAKQRDTVDDHTKKITASTAALADEKTKLAELEKTVDKTSKKYTDQQKAVEKAEKALESANADHKAAIDLQGKLEKSLSEANDELKKQGSYWNKVASAAGNAGEFQQELGRKLTRGVTAPLVGLGTTALWAGVEFESAFAGVEKTVDGTETQINDIRSGLRGMAKEIPTDVSDLSAIAEAAGQLGIETDNVLGFTRVMADLKETTNLGDDGASQLAKFANITQMSQDNFDRLGSSVVELGNNYATTEADIVSMAMRLGAAGKQARMTEPTIFGVATALSSLGIESEAGGSAFSKVISSMQLASETGGKELDQFAKVAGMTGEQFAQTFKTDAASALNAFITGLSSGGDSAIKVLDDIGISEIRMRDALLRASGAGTLFADAIKTSNRAWNENTALAAEADKRYKTTASKLKVLGNQAKDVGISFGEQMIPYLNKGIESVGGLIEGFSGLSEGQKSALVTTGAFAAAIGPVTSVLGKANSGLKSTIEGAKAFKAAMTAAGGGAKGLMSAIGPMGWLALAAGVAVAVAAVYDYASGAKAAREATKQLNETAESWKNTQAKTIFDSGKDPFERFGLDQSIFGQSVQLSKADAKELSALDKTIERLRAKKSKSGELNEADQTKLNEAIQRKVTLNIDYSLGGVVGFDDIQTRLDAEIARLAGLGYTEAEISASVFGDAMNAANEGQIKTMQTLNTAYAAQYAEIAKITDANERNIALEALNDQYAKDRAAAMKEYSDLILYASGKSLNTKDMQEAKDQFVGLNGALRDFASAGGEQNAGAVEGLASFVKTLDEGKLASYVAILTQIGEMRKAGATEEEINTVFPDAAAQEEQYKTILGYLEKYKDLDVAGSKPLEGLFSMLNESLPEEINRVFGDVNAEIKNVTVADGVVLPVIGDLSGTIEKVSKGDTLTWEGEQPAIEATVTQLVDKIPADKRSVTANALINAFQETKAGNLSKEALLAAWTAYINEYIEGPGATATLPTPTVTANVVYNGLNLSQATTDMAKPNGLFGLSASSSEFFATMARDIATYNEAAEGMKPFDRSLLLNETDAMVERGDLDNAISFLQQYNAAVSEGATVSAEQAQQAQSIVDMLTAVEGMGASGNYIKDLLSPLSEGLNIDPENLTSTLSDLGKKAKIGGADVGQSAGEGIGGAMASYDFSADANTTAQNAEDASRDTPSFDSNSPAKKMEPVGADAAAGVGKGMAGYNFTVYAKLMASNAKTKVSSAVTANLASYKSSGQYISENLGKGMLEYDFTTVATTLIDNIMNAIRAATGGGSLTAGVGVGLAGYDFTAYAKQSASRLSEAMESAMGSTIGSNLDFVFGASPALQEFARGIGEQAMLSSPRTGRQSASSNTIVVRAEIDNEKLADAVSRRPISFSVGGRELAREQVNDNSRTLTEHDRRVRAGYGGR